MTKYKILDGQYVEVCGKKLYRIQALKDFARVKVGDIGGYIETESNLSQSDNAWVSGNARVYGDARVSGNARVYGNAWVYGDARVYGNAWVSGNALVSGDARVYGDALVSGNALVSGTRHYLNLGPIGSRDGYTTIYRDKNRKAMVICGCFSGNLDDFERAVHKTHSGTIYEAEYMVLIQLARLREKEWLDEVD